MKKVKTFTLGALVIGMTTAAFGGADPVKGNCKVSEEDARYCENTSQKCIWKDDNGVEHHGTCQNLADGCKCDLTMPW